jgi:lipoteichoic acid synthase
MRKFFNYIDIIVFILIVTLKVLIFSGQTSTGYYSVKPLIIPVLSSVIILASMVCLFGKRKRAKLLYTFNLIISILIICDLDYFRYFKDIISIPVLKNGFQLTAVGSSVGTVFHINDLFYIVDLICIIPLVDYFRYKKGEELKFKIKFALFGIMLLIGCAMDGRSIYSLSVEQPRLLSTMFNRIYVANSLGSLNYHYIDLYNFIVSDLSKHTPLSAEKEDSIKKFLQNNSASTSNMKGALKGKNLIVIQVEALQQFAIGSKVNGMEVTPNLNNWIKRSMYFNNYFYQIAAGGTSDAEFISNNSLYPASSGAAYYLFSGNDYEALPNAFKSQGYETAAMHGYTPTFWNRNVMYPKLGFDNFYSEKDYNIDETVGMGLSDKSFLNQSVEKLKALQNPYYAFLITLSSHYPFNDTKGYGDFNVGKYEGTLLGNYLKAVHYTDAQLGMFLNKLDEEGITKNSLIVIYGDHYAIPKSDESNLADFMNISNPNDLQWMELQRVPLIMHFPDEKYTGVSNLYTGQMDLYPTLDNLFELNSSNLMGKDMFNSKDGKLIFRNGSFTDGNVFYLAPSDTYYDIKTGNTIEANDNLKNKKDDALNELEYSDEILKHNLIKEFKTGK